MKMLKMHCNSFESYEFFQKWILTSNKSLLSTVRTCYCQTQKTLNTGNISGILLCREVKKPIRIAD